MSCNPGLCSLLFACIGRVTSDRAQVVTGGQHSVFMARVLLELVKPLWQEYTTGGFVKTLALWVLVLGMVPQVDAKILLLPSINSVADISAIEVAMEETSEAQDAGRPLTICAWFTPIPKTLMCMSNFVEVMNLTFLRTSIWAEGAYGNPFHSVVDQGHPSVRQNLENARGHDLKSADLVAFFNAADEKCNEGRQFCLSSIEKEFRRTVLSPNVQGGKDFVLLGYSLRKNIFSKPPYIPFLSHEILHAQYFNTPGYKDVVAQFWHSKVSFEDQERIKAVLRNTYGVDDPIRGTELLHNEFQAYLLQPDAKNFHLKDFVDRYQNQLKQALANSGTALVLIE